MKKSPFFALFFAIIVLGGIPTTLHAIGKPIQVTVRHAPAMHLKLGRVVFSEPRGECAAQIISALTEAFVSNNTVVLDRMNMDRILQEHKLDLSGFVDPNTAVQVGRFLGADAMFIVNVSRCRSGQPRYAYRDERPFLAPPYRLYICTIEASISMTFQTVDLASGRILRARNIQKSYTAQTQSREGNPSPPSDFEAIDSAIRQVQGEISHMFFPWTEVRALMFFDDPDYDLKTAYNLFVGGSFDQALTASRSSFQRAEADPKQQSKPDKKLRHAVFNVGMSLFALENYEEALPLFQRAVGIDGGGQYERQALAECDNALRLKQEYRAWEQTEQSANLGGGNPVSVGGVGRQTPPPASSPSPLPNTSAEERLKKLEELFKKGLISKQEYEQKRAQILKEL